MSQKVRARNKMLLELKEDFKLLCEGAKNVNRDQASQNTKLESSIAN